jgi:hypothetical protein
VQYAEGCIGGVESVAACFDIFLEELRRTKISCGLDILGVSFIPYEWTGRSRMFVI